MARTDDFAGRLPVDRERSLLAVGDVVGLLGLLLVGVVSHGGNPVSDPFGTVETAVPFVLAWLVVGTAAGTYAVDRIVDARRSAGLTALAWVAAANVGLILRSSPAFDGGASWPFNLVITGLGLVVLVAWRWAAARAVDRF